MRKPLIIFYGLIIYTIIQVIWWGRLLLAAKPDSLGMIIGESAVFIFIFLAGAFYMHKAIKGERKLHNQPRNLRSPFIALCM
jgi:hypothetical protein